MGRYCENCGTPVRGIFSFSYLLNKFIQRGKARREVDDFLKADQKVNAVKAYRDIIRPMPSLREAVDYVNARQEILERKK